jgi:hypothetical protein
VNESVVVFDRVRETFRDRRFGKLMPAEVMNHAITRTISRTVITHGSTQLMVLSMLIFGGPTLHYFALALTIGILFGIYSSVFVAAAVEQLHGIAHRMAQHAANVMGLRFGQVVLTEGERGIDKEAGQAHDVSTLSRGANSSCRVRCAHRS